MPAAKSVLRGLAPHGLICILDEWNAIEPQRAQLIRDAPLDKLTDVAYVEHELLPQLGLAGTHRFAFPTELQPHLDQGLHSFQWPNQLAPYLVHLSRYPIRRYLEIGVFRGGTFITTVEYLARFGAIEHAVAVDLNEGLPIRKYRRAMKRDVEFVQTFSGTPEFRTRVEQWRPDLVLIDADHSYASVKKDFGCVEGIAPLIAFHDITDNASPGVARLWGELKDSHAGEYDFHEFTAQYPEITESVGGMLLGLGLMVRKDAAPRP